MVRIRLATKSDADAIAAIYAPFVEQSAVSFEIVPPIPDEISRRIVETTMAYPWLVCEMNEVVVGYAYATQHRVRAAYRWSVDTSAYIAAAYHRRWDRPGALRVAVRDSARAGLLQCVCRHHAPQRRKRQTARGGRL